MLSSTWIVFLGRASQLSTDFKLDTYSSSRISSPTLSGSISTPLGRTRNCLWQLLVETLLI
jgi:hypothetical protein